MNTIEAGGVLSTVDAAPESGRPQVGTMPTQEVVPAAALALTDAERWRARQQRQVGDKRTIRGFPRQARLEDEDVRLSTDDQVLVALDEGVVRQAESEEKRADPDEYDQHVRDWAAAISEHTNEHVLSFEA